MATWVRNGTGTLPSATNASVAGTIELDNGTAPDGFDATAVNSVRIQYRTEIGSGTFTAPEDHDVLQAVDLTLNGVGSLIASIAPGSTPLNGGTDPIDTDATDSSILTTWTVAQWEGAELNPNATNWTTYNQDMGPDGVLVQIASTGQVVTVTIDYTPDPDRTAVLTALAVTSTFDAVVAVGDITFPVRRETSSGFNNTSETGYTVALDDGAAIEGDLAIIHMIGSSSGGKVTTTTGVPSGWTEVFNRSHTDYSYWLGWKVLVAGDISTPTAIFSCDAAGLHAHQIDIIKINTFDSADPIDVSDEDFPTATSATTVTVVTTGTNELLMIYAGMDVSTGETWSIDTGTENFDSTLGSEFLSISGYESEAATATTYNRTVTTSAATQDIHGGMLAVNAVADGDATATCTTLVVSSTFDAVTTVNDVNATTVQTALAVTSTFDPAVAVGVSDATAVLTTLVVTSTFDASVAVGEVNATTVLTTLIVASTFDPAVAVGEVNATTVLTTLVVTSTFDPVVTANEVNATTVLTALVVQATFDAVVATGTTPDATAVLTTLIVSSTFDPVVATSGVIVTLTALVVSSTFDPVTTVNDVNATANATALLVQSTFDAVVASGVSDATATLTTLTVNATFDAVTAVGEVNASTTLTALIVTGTFDPVVATNGAVAVLTSLVVTATFDPVVAVGDTATIESWGLIPI